MKKILIASFFSTLIFGGANAAGSVEWWKKPTICTLATTNNPCYSNVKVTDQPAIVNEWDAVANCWGKKKVCPNAVIPAETEPVVMSKSEILNPAKVNQDFEFETNAVNRRPGSTPCFGVRKTRNNRSEARVSDSKSSKWVRVYCKGIYEDPDEELTGPNGDEIVGEIMITEGRQATCQSLKETGHISVLVEEGSNKCYGDRLNKGLATEFFIECKGDNLLPEKIVHLEGAKDPVISTAANPSESPYPTTEEEVKALFSKMLATARDQRNAKAVAIIAEQADND